MPDKVVTILYTNWRGETAHRNIVPSGVEFASTEWHPEPQWLLHAYDMDKKAQRTFAMKDIKEWLVGMDAQGPKECAHEGCTVLMTSRFLQDHKKIPENCTLHQDVQPEEKEGLCQHPGCGNRPRESFMRKLRRRPENCSEHQVYECDEEYNGCSFQADKHGDERCIHCGEARSS